ncbi:GCN5-related N-acetyltransferase [Syntrophobotulus glycolicus DSM 8271]|uniref:GCN5-related N-acetyltransferase n=1 Tax=Syntrophobotulus glycolicus (strain DSM 8271 / FlGlyR) TaxID=645991 RepID=F0SYW2_SYNGF|nr:GNAT family N-acetyltransferase [Syntrophobotulus glycolicus]ADY55999.1 GCN5-related N-acetyltransferase [Syntrophobotulus glycolicus DSM 8271]
MILETNRLVLRPWKETDAESLYEYAKDPLIGPIAGWPVHTSVENSLQIIREVLSLNETYAVTIKKNDNAIGSIGLMIGNKSNLDIGNDQAEIGYWIGVPYWGQGLIPEAVCELMRHAFDELGLTTLWCGYFDGNEKSKRVQEKCGFKFHHTEKDKKWPLINVINTLHVTCVTLREWKAF